MFLFKALLGDFPKQKKQFHHCHENKTLFDKIIKKKIKYDVIDFQTPIMPTENSFVTGMKLEAVDKADPNLVRPATIYSTNGHKMRIRFV